MPDEANVVKEKTDTTGTGNLTLNAFSNARQFSDAFSTGGTNVFFYHIDHETAVEEEYGYGHLVDASTLSRDTVIFSTNANGLVSFSSGSKVVICEGGINPNGDHEFGSVKVTEGDISDDQGNTIYDYSAQQIGDGSVSASFGGGAFNGSVSFTDPSTTTIPGAIHLTNNRFITSADDSANQTRILGHRSNDIFMGDIDGISSNLRLRAGGSDILTLDTGGNVTINTGGDLLNAGKIRLSDTDGDGNETDLRERGASGEPSFFVNGSLAMQFNVTGTNNSIGFLSADTDTGTNAVFNGIDVLKKDSGSSRRFKSEIEPADISMQSILAIEPKHFFHEQIDEYRHGLIAEDVRDAGFPEWVHENSDGEVESLSYGKFGATVALAGIHNLHERVKKLEQEVA